MANEYGAGYHTRCGIGLESLAGTYGALVVPTILQTFEDESIDQVTEWLEQNVLVGKRAYEYPTIIGHKTSGVLRVRAHHRISEFLWYAGLGGTSGISGVAAPYIHTIDKGEDILRAMSIVIDKDPDGGNVIKPWEFQGAVINKLTLTSTVNDGCHLEIELVCYKVTRSVTHRAALAALVFNERAAELFHSDWVLRLADTVDALAAGDAQNISDFSLAIDNKLLTDDQTCASGLYIHKPRPNGKAEVTLSFSLPRYEADTLIDAKDAGTLLQADLINTGATLGGGTFLTTIQLPSLYIKSLPAPVGGEEKVALSGNAQCYRNNGNTNMSAVTEEIRVIIQNSNDTLLAWVA